MKPFDVYPLMDIHIERSLGSHVWDKHGRQYLDFYGGHAVISIGHSHPHFLMRIKEQLDKMAFYSNSIQNDLKEQLAMKMGELSGYPDYQLFLVNSGAEAIENALKLASFKNGRTKVVSFEKAFHGRTSAAVHITDHQNISAKINQGFERKILPWNDLNAVQKELSKGDVCAVVAEGVQGIGGIHVPDPSFLQSVEQQCKKYGTILLLDEIQSGYGRTGKFFAHQFADVRPDLVTVAKGMGNGFPTGGVLISPEFKPKYGLLGTTFGGTQLACAAGLAVLEIIEKEQLIENAKQRGAQLKKGLAKCAAITEVRGLGCMIGLDLPFAAKPFRKRLIEEFGVFTGTSSQPNTLRVLPPLSVNEKEIEAFLTAFDTCLEAHQKQIQHAALPVS
ncbi:MAG: aminotransferase class III-fold pyridoxal phosphate-dependent enzyme [Bacteroidota bacterium]